MIIINMYSIIYDNQGNQIHTNSEQGRDLVKQYIRIVKGGSLSGGAETAETIQQFDYFRSTVDNLTQHYFQLDYFFLTGFQYFQKLNVFRSRIMDEYKTLIMSNNNKIPVLFIWKYTKPNFQDIFSEEQKVNTVSYTKYYSYCLLEVDETFSEKITKFDSDQREFQSTRLLDNICLLYTSPSPRD